MRAIHRLSDRKVKNVGEGLHADGGNLLLQVTRGVRGQLNRSWLFRFALGGRERRMGLGSYPTVSLADARERPLMRASCWRGALPRSAPATLCGLPRWWQQRC